MEQHDPLFYVIVTASEWNGRTFYYRCITPTTPGNGERADLGTRIDAVKPIGFTCLPSPY